MPLKNLCRAFGNPQRVRLIACLSRQSTVSELLRKCDLSQSALSQHLAILRNAGLVHTRESGRHVYYKIASPTYARLARNVLAITKTI